MIENNHIIRWRRVVLLLIAIAALLLIAAAFPPFSIVLQILTDEQTLVLSLVAMAILQFLKIVWVGLLKRPKPSTGVMRWALAVIGIGFGVLWGGVKLPPLDDPMTFLTALVTLAGTVVIYAGLVYDYLVERILGWLDTAALRSRLLKP